MGQVILGTTMSLDGFINDSNGDVSRLYPDLAALSETEILRESIRVTGAAVMGRHAFDMAQGDLTGYEYQVPIFVVTHGVPNQVIRGENENLKVFFVTDGLASAIAQAKAAAGDRDVTIVGGADIAQQCLKAGLADQLHIGIIPVLLGTGLRFFEPLGIEPLQLEQIKILESPGRTDIQFRILK